MTPPTTPENSNRRGGLYGLIAWWPLGAAIGVGLIAWGFLKAQVGFINLATKDNSIKVETIKEINSKQDTQIALLTQMQKTQADIIVDVKKSVDKIWMKVRNE